jgi:hypothetical protein
MLGGVGAGLAVAMHGAYAYTHRECVGSSCWDSHDINMTEFGIGAALMTAGVFISIPFMASRDTVHLRVIPVVTPGALVAPRVASLERPPSQVTAQGLTLSATW